MRLKNILIIVLALVSLTAYAFDGFVPASELSGRYLKFSSYYKKTFKEFEDGFDEMGFSVAKPNLWGKFGLELQMVSFGDEVLKQTQFYLSPGYKVTDNLTFALSAGLLRNSYDQKNMIFSEAETLADDNKLVGVFGASMHLNMFNKRLKFGLGAYNVNEPDISATGANGVEDKLPMKIVANLDWRVTSWLKLSPYFMHENDENYYGINVGVSYPDETFTMNVGASGEKVSITPEINTMNYWNFKVGYDYHLEEDLQGTNYYIFASHEFVDAGEMKIVFDNNQWNNDNFETPDRSIKLAFNIEGQERVRSVVVKKDDEEILYKRNLREYDEKSFAQHLALNPGINKIYFYIEGLAETYERTVEVAYTSNEINVMPVDEVIMDGNEVTINFTSTVINGNYEISLIHNGEEQSKLTTSPITASKDDTAYEKQYSFNWLASGIERGTGHNYYFKINELTHNLSAVSNTFTGDLTPRVWVVELEDIVEKLANNKTYTIKWKSDVEEASFMLYLYENGVMKKQLTELPVTEGQMQDDEIAMYAFNWDVKGLQNNEEFSYKIKLVEQLKNIERVSARFVSNFGKPKPPKPVIVYDFVMQNLPGVVENNKNVAINFSGNYTETDYEIYLLKNGIPATKIADVKASDYTSKDDKNMNYSFNWAVKGLAYKAAYQIKIANNGKEKVSNSFKLKAQPKPKPKPQPKPQPKKSNAWIWIVIGVVVVFIIIIAKKKKKK